MNYANEALVGGYQAAGDPAAQELIKRLYQKLADKNMEAAFIAGENETLRKKIDNNDAALHLQKEKCAILAQHATLQAERIRQLQGDYYDADSQIDQLQDQLRDLKQQLSDSEEAEKDLVERLGRSDRAYYEVFSEYGGHDVAFVYNAETNPEWVKTELARLKTAISTSQLQLKEKNDEIDALKSGIRDYHQDDDKKKQPECGGKCLPQVHARIESLEQRLAAVNANSEDNLQSEATLRAVIENLQQKMAAQKESARNRFSCVLEEKVYQRDRLLKEKVY